MLAHVQWLAANVDAISDALVADLPWRCYRDRQRDGRWAEPQAARRVAL